MGLVLDCKTIKIKNDTSFSTAYNLQKWGNVSDGELTFRFSVKTANSAYLRLAPREELEPPEANNGIEIILGAVDDGHSEVNQYFTDSGLDNISRQYHAIAPHLSGHEFKPFKLVLKKDRLAVSAGEDTEPVVDFRNSFVSEIKWIFFGSWGQPTQWMFGCHKKLNTPGVKIGIDALVHPVHQSTEYCSKLMKELLGYYTKQECKLPADDEECLSTFSKIMVIYVDRNCTKSQLDLGAMPDKEIQHLSKALCNMQRLKLLGHYTEQNCSLPAESEDCRLQLNKLVGFYKEQNCGDSDLEYSQVQRTSTKNCNNSHSCPGKETDNSAHTVTKVRQSPPITASDKALIKNLLNYYTEPGSNQTVSSKDCHTKMNQTEGQRCNESTLNSDERLMQLQQSQINSPSKDFCMLQMNMLLNYYTEQRCKLPVSSKDCGLELNKILDFYKNSHCKKAHLESDDESDMLNQPEMFQPNTLESDYRPSKDYCSLLTTMLEKYYREQECNMLSRNQHCQFELKKIMTFYKEQNCETSDSYLESSKAAVQPNRTDDPVRLDQTNHPSKDYCRVLMNTLFDLYADQGCSVLADREECQSLLDKLKSSYKKKNCRKSDLEPGDVSIEPVKPGEVVMLDRNYSPSKDFCRILMEMLQDYYRGQECNLLSSSQNCQSDLKKMTAFYKYHNCKMAVEYGNVSDQQVTAGEQVKQDHTNRPSKEYCRLLMKQLRDIYKDHECNVPPGSEECQSLLHRLMSSFNKKNCRQSDLEPDNESDEPVMSGKAVEQDSDNRPSKDFCRSLMKMLEHYYHAYKCNVLASNQQCESKLKKMIGHYKALNCQMADMESDSGDAPVQDIRYEAILDHTNRPSKGYCRSLMKNLVDLHSDQECSIPSSSEECQSLLDKLVNFYKKKNCRKSYLDSSDVSMEPRMSRQVVRLDRAYRPSKDYCRLLMTMLENYYREQGCNVLASDQNCQAKLKKMKAFYKDQNCQKPDLDSSEVPLQQDRTDEPVRLDQTNRSSKVHCRLLMKNLFDLYRDQGCSAAANSEECQSLLDKLKSSYKKKNCTKSDLEPGDLSIYPDMSNKDVLLDPSYCPSADFCRILMKMLESYYQEQKCIMLSSNQNCQSELKKIMAFYKGQNCKMADLEYGNVPVQHFEHFSSAVHFTSSGFLPVVMPGDSVMLFQPLMRDSIHHHSKAYCRLLMNQYYDLYTDQDCRLPVSSEACQSLLDKLLISYKKKNCRMSDLESGDISVDPVLMDYLYRPSADFCRLLMNMLVDYYHRKECSLPASNQNCLSELKYMLAFYEKQNCEKSDLEPGAVPVHHLVTDELTLKPDRSNRPSKNYCRLLMDQLYDIYSDQECSVPASSEECQSLLDKLLNFYKKKNCRKSDAVPVQQYTDDAEAVQQDTTDDPVWLERYEPPSKDYCRLLMNQLFDFYTDQECSLPASGEACKSLLDKLLDSYKKKNCKKSDLVTGTVPITQVETDESVVSLQSVKLKRSKRPSKDYCTLLKQQIFDYYADEECSLPASSEDCQLLWDKLVDFYKDKNCKKSELESRDDRQGSLEVFSPKHWLHRAMERS